MNLQRRAPLAPGTQGLSRGNGPARRTELSRGNGPGLSRGAQLNRGNGPARRPGPARDPPVTTGLTLEAGKLVVRERDGNRCARCGRPAGPGNRQTQHRAPRGIGGRPDRIAHRLSGLVLLCGWSATDPAGCHYWAESHLEPADRREGFRVPAGVDPAVWPVHYWDGWFLLDDDGGRIQCCAPPLEV